ncbi:hypothetical protein [Bartonella senegalensis]|uniref:hypothetical protein n=1 Tax=Bartonella senegalensis TaxID=1468418 RepID=UPI000318CF9C|nr:hypothetical protein [Bartonella senegalensis]
MHLHKRKENGARWIFHYTLRRCCENGLWCLKRCLRDVSLKQAREYAPHMQSNSVLFCVMGVTP